MLIVFNQVLPVINGGSIKLWPIFGISIHPTHLHKLWQSFLLCRLSETRRRRLTRGCVGLRIFCNTDIGGNLHNQQLPALKKVALQRAIFYL
jgi:hypothetical protein